MRPLTPAELREIESIQRTIRTYDADIEVRDSNRELWLNALEMILQTNQALLTAWRKSDKVTL